MNTPLDEIKRLRGQLDAKERELADLRGLVNQHLADASEREALALERERAAYERGVQHGDEQGWRRGVEHALSKVDEAHWLGTAHDHHGQMRELGLHDGPVPAPKTAEQVVADADRQSRIQAEWWAREYD